MELDARRILEGTALEADICIVGAGPAGITLAREFIGHKADVLILESGGLEPEEHIQQLNEGTVMGDPYAGLRQTRYRRVGGTVSLWNTPVGNELGAKYVPLDPWDFEGWGEFADSRWPFDYSHLEPFYRRAQALCGLGPFAYAGSDWSDGERPCLALEGEHLTTRVYQFGVGHLFTQSYPRELRRSDNVYLCHQATVCALKTQEGVRRVVGAKLVGPSGRRFRVAAAIFVLATGAIETPRLLLLSGGEGLDALGNRHGWVGRCFMEHPRDYALTLIPRSPELFSKAVFYDAHPARDGTIVGGRLALDERTIRTARLPNASITLLPRLKMRTSPDGMVDRFLARLHQFAGRQPRTGYGWSRIRDVSRPFDAFQLLVNLEQQPNPENRVLLAQERDSLDIPKVEVHWRWREEEQAGLERLRSVLASSLEATGLGQVEVRTGLRPDPNAHHHAGTTRMHGDPRCGVVDADSRVHGTDNLYVTGASVFSTSGFANPTLTIVALALRLADHLKRRI